MCKLCDEGPSHYRAPSTPDPLADIPDGLADYAAGVSGPAGHLSRIPDSVLLDMSDKDIDLLAAGAMKSVSEGLREQREEARQRAADAVDEEEIDLDEMFPADLAAMLAHELVESKYYDADSLIAGLRQYLAWDVPSKAKG